jgi:penicillin-binding protein 1B
VEHGVLDVLDVLRARIKARIKKALQISCLVFAVVFQAGVIAVAVKCIRISISLKNRLADLGPCASTTLVSQPSTIAIGDEFNTGDIATELRAAGSPYRLSPDAITVSASTRIHVSGGKITEILDVQSHQPLGRFELAPQVLAQVHCGVLDDRRPVTFAQIPQTVVHALLSAEDKHFFVHAGFDPFRLAKSVWVNLKSGRPDQGGSTLTMQLARSLYLDPEKTWGRKFQEILIAEVLEVRLSKKQILEQYANRIYFGRRAGVNITGFEAAAEYYFGRSLSELSVGQAAMLAGIVQRPSYFDPFRHPDRVLARRNKVLALMERNGYLSDTDRIEAARTPLSTARGEANRPSAPWFVSLALNQLGKSAGPRTESTVASTLDPLLQRAAVEAVAAGLQEVDKRAASTGPGRPEVALVALDPRTGEVRALVGGRDYSKSEVNHAIAQRQPGSVFKPFVYAAALQSPKGRFTPATLLDDEPTTFKFGVQEYTPGNFGESYGQLTLRRALAYSDNIATVSLAEQVGYDNVAKLALAAGFNDRIRPTPALALGAYESTPLEIAGAYSVFANAGVASKPTFLIRNAQPAGPALLNPQIAFLMQDLLAEVIRSGTAWDVHARGFNGPSAGKTGTTRDGWFAGYVSNLICVVWVGYDDNTDLKLEGAKSALPIWTEFMKRAAKRAQYRQPLGKIAPGITMARIDADSGLLAGPNCVKVRMEYFLRGTEPHEICDHDARDSGGASRVGTPAASPAAMSASASPTL